MKNYTFTALAMLSFSTAYAEDWLTDYEAAKKKAAAENKSLLVDFTGSDWCHWCIQLKKEVFDHAEFGEGTKDKFVLLELDFPNDKSKQSQELIKQNQELRQKYGVNGFPTLILMDATGRPYAQTGYQQGGPVKYVEHLDELLVKKNHFDSAMEKASSLEGMEKAKVLVEGMNHIGQSHRIFYSDLTDQIAQLDPKDELGFVSVEKARNALSELEKNLNKLYEQKDFTKMNQAIDDYITEYKPAAAQHQVLLFQKIQFLMALEKLDEALELYEEVVKMEGTPNIVRALPKVKKALDDKIAEKAAKEEMPAE